MITPIEFDCLYWDQSQSELNDLGIRPSIEECETRPIIFYRIDHIKPYYEGEHSFCAIHSSGEEYIVRKSYDELKELLK